MRIAKITVALAALAAAGALGRADAAVVGGSITRTTNQGAPAGTFVLLDPTAADPFVVGGDVINDPNLYAFDEVQGYALTSPLTVTGPDGSVIALPTGTVLNSHYVEWDPSLEGRGRADITVTFDGPILGVIVARQGLVATDAEFGADHVEYRNDGPRGLEQPGDTFTIAGNTISLNVFARAPDGFRVFTLAAPAAPVPVPAAGWMMAAGLAGAARLGGLRVRVKARRA